jgi:hypothetical protein
MMMVIFEDKVDETLTKRIKFKLSELTGIEYYLLNPEDIESYSG